MTYFCVLQNAIAVDSALQGIEWTEVERKCQGCTWLHVSSCLAFYSWTWFLPCGHFLFHVFSPQSVFSAFLCHSVGKGGLQFFQPWAEGVVSSVEAARGWWAVGQALKAAHCSPQVECFLLLHTDRPDCVDGRLSFIFYSHLKNMKEIYVTSPVDRKGQAVKGQVTSCFLLHPCFYNTRHNNLWVLGMTLFLPSFSGFAFDWVNSE